jgi:hypothetical protein
MVDPLTGPWRTNGMAEMAKNCRIYAINSNNPLFLKGYLPNT